MHLGTVYVHLYYDILKIVILVEFDMIVLLLYNLCREDLSFVSRIQIQIQPLILRQNADEVPVQHLEGGFRMADAPELVACIPAAVFHQNLCATRVLAEELSEVIDLVIDDHPALVLPDLLEGYLFKCIVLGGNYFLSGIGLCDARRNW